MPRRVRDYADPPHCYKDDVIFDRQSSICRDCPFFLPCGTSLGETFGISRKEFEWTMARGKVPFRDAVDAVVEQFDDVTVNAAELSYTRKIKKVGI